jgi:hypothetical protein
MEKACLSTMWCPVFRWLEFNLGVNMELGNSSSNAKRKPISGTHEKGK